MSQTYTYTFRLKDLMTSAFDKLNGGASGLYKQMTRLNKCMWQFNQTAELFERAGQTIERIAEPGRAFEQSMADLSAITGIAGDELERLNKTARKTGRQSGLGATQAADAYKILASQIDVTKIGLTGLQELQKRSITLSQASGLEMSQAALALSGTINQFGLQASEANRVINVLAAGSKYGAAEIPELAQSFKVVGAAANAAGLNVESTAGIIEVLSKNNMKGAEAGTALRNILLKMQTELGVDFSKTSMSDALETLKPKLNDVTFLTKTFGMENTVAAQFLIQNADLVGEMTGRVTDTNVAMEQASIRTGTWRHKMQVWQATLNDVGISLHQHAGGLLTVVQMGSQLFSGMVALGPIFNLVKGSIMGVTQAITWLTVAENRRTMAKKISAAWDYIAIASLYAYDAVVGIVTGQVSIATVVQNAWNVAMVNNPVGWVIAGIAAMVGVVILCWKKFEGFRNVVNGVWGSMKQFGKVLYELVIGRILDLVKGIGKVGKALVQLFNRDFKEAWATAKDGAMDISGISSRQRAFEEGNKMSEAYEKGKQRGADRYSRRQAKKQAKNGQATPELLGAYEQQPDNGLNQTAGLGNANALMPDSTTTTTGSGSSTGGSSGKNVNVQIGKLVENITLHCATVKEGAEEIKNIVEEYLIRATNSIAYD